MSRLQEWHRNTDGSRFLTSEGALSLPAILADLNEGFHAFIFDQFGITVSDGAAGSLESASLGESGVSHGSVASYQSAFKNAQRRHTPRLRFTEDQEEEMSEVFKTLKKLDARRRMNAGQGARRTGKAPLQQAVYRDMAQHFLVDRSDATCWTHLYLLFTWNLMCRADNTDQIAVADLGWEEDSLTVRFAMSKTDQAGTKGDLERHLFANPGKQLTKEVPDCN